MLPIELKVANTISRVGANPSADRIFFPNLNGLRFLAVLLVVVDHVEGIRMDFGLSNFWNIQAIPVLGQTGVDLFFVLSGFLITYLLLVEKQRMGTIDFRAFYLRRTLRIWPLYYVMVMLGLFVLPRVRWLVYPVLTSLVSTHLVTKALLYAVFLPNAVKELYPAVPYLSQAWSIGVEEQFYIIWPVLVYFSRNYVRNFLLLVGIVVILTQLSWALTTPWRQVLPINELTTFVKCFLVFFRIQCMAIGGGFAVLLYQRRTRLLALLTARPVQWLLWLLLPLLLLKGELIPYFSHELYAVIFGVLVLNLAQTETSIVGLRGRGLDFLGRISYGLYMLHPLAVCIAIRLVTGAGLADGAAHHAAVFGGALLLSVGLGWVSYHWLETPFLRLKERFARVPSGA